VSPFSHFTTTVHVLDVYMNSQKTDEFASVVWLYGHRDHGKIFLAPCSMLIRAFLLKHTHTHARTHARTHAHTHTHARARVSVINSLCFVVSHWRKWRRALGFKNHSDKCMTRAAVLEWLVSPIWIFQL
jgi:hypothetical protein